MAFPTALACGILGSGLIACCFQPEGTVVQRFSLILAVSAMVGLLLLLVGVHGISASSDAVVASQLMTRKIADKIVALRMLVQDVREAETGQRGYLLTGDRQYRTARRSTRVRANAIWTVPIAMCEISPAPCSSTAPFVFVCRAGWR